MEETSVSEKIDADLCPICLDVFFSTQEFLQHVQETYHISSKSNCSKTIKSCESDNMCPLCQDSIFGEPANLLKHMFEKHSVSSKETCQKCLQDCIKTECDENVSSVKIESCETKIKMENDNFSDITSFLESSEWEPTGVIKFEGSSVAALDEQAKFEDCNPPSPCELSNKSDERHEPTQTMQISETQSKIQENSDLSSLNVFGCELCAIKCPSQIILKSHMENDHFFNTTYSKKFKSMEEDKVDSQEDKESDKKLFACLKKLERQDRERSVIEEDTNKKQVIIPEMDVMPNKAGSSYHKMLNAVGPLEMDILNRQRAEEEALKRASTIQVSNIKYDKFGFVMAQVQQKQPIISATKKDHERDRSRSRSRSHQ